MTNPPFEHGDLVEIPINISILFVILRVIPLVLSNMQNHF